MFLTTNRLTDVLQDEQTLAQTVKLTSPVVKTKKQEQAEMFAALAKEQGLKQRTEETFEFIDKLLKNIIDNPD